MPKALIIKGNPIYLENNPLADTFYSHIHAFLLDLNIESTFISCFHIGEFPNAEIWIGHSRGGYTLSKAPRETLCIAIGSSVEGAINHTKDNVFTFWREKEKKPNKYHYVFTEEMKSFISMKLTENFKITI